MTRLLDTIQSPRDLSKLSLEKLPALAQEIRQYLQKHSTLRDAYRASAIGLTELTIALHFVYDFAHDKLVFDMAHQCAAHAVLTRDRKTDDDANLLAHFASGKMRSAYEQFVSAHAGTSISTALGIACGQTDDAKTVAVIGDGAIVSGVALEALNCGGALDRDVLVILNDNEMSISKVVGAMGEYLAKIRVGKTYADLKRDAHKLVQSIPLIGERLDKAAEQLKEAVAKALVPGHMFESLGPRYFGPVDGHNVAHLVNLLREIKRQKGFFLLHVVTRRDGDITRKKTKAQMAAEAAKAPQSLGLDAEQEFKRQGEERWDAAAARAVAAIADRDPAAVVVLADAPESPAARSFRDAFRKFNPPRLWDVDICEQHGMAFAAGLARAGKRPIVVVSSTFLQRAYDQVFQEIALNRLPVTLLVVQAGVADVAAAAHHGFYDLAYLRALPGIELYAPRDARELRGMLDIAVRRDQPVAVRIPQTFAPDEDSLYDEHAEIFPGRSEVLRRGSDIGIIALGSMVYPVMEAADLLAEKGIESTVVNVRFVRPLDTDSLKRVIQEHTLSFTVEEAAISGGLAAAVLEEGARSRWPIQKVCPIGVGDQVLPQGQRFQVLRAAGLDGVSLADRMLLDYRRHVRTGART